MDVDEDKVSLLEELENSFDEYSISVSTKHSEKVFKKSSALCKKYGLSADEFVETWFAYAASNSINEINIETLGVFEQRELVTLKNNPSKLDHEPSIAKIKIKTEVPTEVEIFGDVSSSKVNSDADPEIENVDDLDPVLQAYGLNSANTVTPKTKKVSRQQKPDNMLNNGNMLTPAGFSPAVQLKSTSYSARGRAGDSVLRYKCKDSDYWNEISDNNVPVKVFPAQATKSLLESETIFKYMFQKTPDMSSTLNDTLFGLALSISSILKDEELQDLRESSVVDGWYLGKICSTEGKLTPGSIYLEGDIDISGGHIVWLDLSTVEEYRLFSGQTVLVKGQNELGKCIKVSEVVHPAPLPMPNILSKITRPLNIIVACGPYTPIDSLLYEALNDLLEVIKRDKPDVCILLGPFIDSSHPMIVDGYIAETFDELFDKMIEKLRVVKEEVKTHIVLVSSYKDAHHHPVYPTPPYAIKYVDKITVLPDPSVIEVGGITIGLTSTDSLLHLAGNEIARSTVSDRMSGLSKHILSQHNFYPLYPPEESVPLDVQLGSKYCKFLEATPHIIVMPSDLRYFIKEVEGTIVVNPEKLTKFRSGGTYARLQVKLPETFEGNSVADFCCGEIIKI